MQRTLATLALALAGAAALPAAAAADVFQVTKTADTNDGVCDDDCSLREAIVEANNTVAGTPHDVLIPAGTYNLTLNAACGGPAGTLFPSLDMNILGAGIDATIIDGQGVDRVFAFARGDDPVTITIEDLTIRNGYDPGTCGGIRGAGIRNLGTRLEIRRVRMTDNHLWSGDHSAYGGAISSENGIVIVRDSEFTANSANAGDSAGAAFGGAIGLVENNPPPGVTLVDIFGSLVAGNEANPSDTADAWTGGIFVETGLNIQECMVADNTRGALWFDVGNILQTTIARNGAFSSRFSTVASSVVVTRAGTVTNSTLSGNEAGLLLNGGNDLLVLVSTFVAGETPEGGLAPTGPILSTAGETDDIFIRASIVDDPVVGCAGDVVSGDYNIDRGATCGFGELHDLSNTNPLLGPLADNGGPLALVVPTHLPMTGSPAIDSVDPLLTGMDQREVSRPQDGDGDTIALVDRGSVEVEGAPEPCGCLDLDQDGWVTFYGPCPGEGAKHNRWLDECKSFNDCDDTDPTIHPFAPEIPNDGIDQNCNSQMKCGAAGDDGAMPWTAAALAFAAVAIAARRRRAR